MAPTVFDPYAFQERLLWQNRVARWRARGVETAFHACALAALATVLVWPLPGLFARADDAGAALQFVFQRWPWAAAAASFGMMLLSQRRMVLRLRARRATDWLGTQPIPVAVHVRRQRRRQAALAVAHIALAGLAVRMASAGFGWIVAAMTAAVAAAVLAARGDVVLPRVAAPARLRSTVADADAGTGRLWRWQRIEAGIALRGRSLAGGALLLLLVPAGSGPFAVLWYAAAGLALAASMTAWRRSLAVLPAAQIWLGTQPLRPAQLLRRCASVPAAMLVFACLLVLAGASALGALRIGVALMVGIAALAALQFVCVAAHRDRPHRAGLAFAVHTALLLGVLQALPMMAVVLWLAQVAVLLRRAGQVR